MRSIVIMLVYICSFAWLWQYVRNTGEEEFLSLKLTIDWYVLILMSAEDLPSTTTFLAIWYNGISLIVAIVWFKILWIQRMLV